MKKMLTLLVLFASFVSFSQDPVLLIPESTNDRIMSFSTEDGSLLNASFISGDPTHLSTPIEALYHPLKGTILVSDQIEDVIQEYDISGNYIGVFAPIGGPNTAILDNVRGIEVKPDGNVLVTVGGGTNAHCVAEFNMDGNYLGNFISNGSGGLDSPFDVVYRSNKNDYLVTAINSDNILRYDHQGNFIEIFATVDDFPEQASISYSSNHVFVGNFSGTQEGILEFDENGNLLNTIIPTVGGGYRGVFELSNGNLLISNSSGVYEINHSGNTISTSISGVSARFISLYDPNRLLTVPFRIEFIIALFALLFALKLRKHLF